MHIYRYLCCWRPPMLGAVPKDVYKIDDRGYKTTDANGGTRYVWGAVEYTRKLTDREVYEYELEFESEGEVE